MDIDRANALLQRYRYAVADTCKAKAIFNDHLTGPSEEYQAARTMLERFLAVEASALVACQNAMLDCGCQERERGRSDRELDFMEEEGRCQSNE